METDGGNKALDIGPSRLWHLGAAMLVALVGLGISRLTPSLVEKPSDLLAFIGTFSTFYGVVFAIIEVLRLQAVAKVAAEEAKRVYEQLTHVRMSEMAGRCQAMINAALTNADSSSTIPTAMISDIRSMYREMLNSGPERAKEHDDLETILSSYMGQKTHDRYVKPLKLMGALSSMSANLATFKNRNNQISGKMK